MKFLKIGVLVIVALVVGCALFVFVRAAGADARMTFSDTPAPNIVASTDPAVIARGAYLVHAVAHCSQCHGTYERMKPEDNVDSVALSGGLDFPMGPMGTFHAANLTTLARRSDAEIARTIATGVMPDGHLSIFMRYSSANLSAEDLAAVLSYLRSTAPVDKAVPDGGLTTIGKAAFSFFTVAPDTRPLPAHVEAAAEPSVARGEYLAEHVALCIACHTTYDPTTFEPNGPRAGGGIVEPSHGTDSDKEFAAPNLTSSAMGMTGKLSEDAFVARMRQGRAFPSSLMPWENFGRMTDSDARSIYRYLRTLPPIERDPGPSYRDVGWTPPG